MYWLVAAYAAPALLVGAHTYLRLSHLNAPLPERLRAAFLDGLTWPAIFKP